MNEYTQTVNFWQRLKNFIENVQVNDPMSEEEKEMILINCELKIKQYDKSIYKI